MVLTVLGAVIELHHGVVDASADTLGVGGIEPGATRVSGRTRSWRRCLRAAEGIHEVLQGLGAPRVATNIPAHLADAAMEALMIAHRFLGPERCCHLFTYLLTSSQNTIIGI